MNISKITIMDILNGEQQLVMPIYQRRYSWEGEQCKDLIRDVLRANTTNREHFIGPIVVVVEDGGLGSIRKFQVIDGQQRLTTIYLLLLAVYNYLIETTPEDVCAKEKFSLKNILFMGRIGLEDYDLKIKPTDLDKDILKNVVNQQSLSKLDSAHNITKNYNFFYNGLKSNDFSFEEILGGINLLRFAQIRLDFADDPQTTFESLNATGKGLTEGDLIQNFIFMGIPLSEQNRLYNTYWKKLYSEMFEEDGKLDTFLIFFLENRLCRVVSNQNLHQEFKTFYYEYHDVRSGDSKSIIELENLLKDLINYWRVYKMIKYKTHPIDVFNNYFEVFKVLDVDKMKPLLAELVLLHEKGALSIEEFCEICEVLESYIFRRSLCVKGDKKKYPTIVLSLISATYLPEDATMQTFNVKDSVLQAFIERSTFNDIKTFPSDRDFKQALKSIPIYSPSSKKNSIAKYVLLKFANYKSKEILNINSFTIEHIMPQTLTPRWKYNLGQNWEEVHTSYLHTLGNLTLTKANSEMGNKTFEEKKMMEKGFNQSNLWLNEDLKSYDVWNEETILKRADLLGDIALQIWKYPKKLFSQSVKKVNPPSTAILSIENEWTHCEVKGYSFLGEGVEVESFTHLLLSFCETVYELNETIFEQYNDLHKDSEYPLFTKEAILNGVEYKKIPNTPWMISIYLKKNAEKKRRVILDLISLLGLSFDEFYLVVESTNSSLKKNSGLSLSDDWTSLSFEGYSFLGESKEVFSAISLLMDVLTILYSKYGEKLFKEYRIHYKSASPWISEDITELRSAKRLDGTSFYIEANLANESKKVLLERLFSLCGIHNSELIIYGEYKQK